MSLDLVRWGADRLRVGPWRGDARVAYIAPLADGAPAAVEAVRRCCEVLGGRGFREVITAALGPAESRGFIEAGFQVRERLHLLAHDLLELPSAPTAPLRRGRRIDRGGARSRRSVVRHVLAPGRRRLRRSHRGHAVEPVPHRRRRPTRDRLRRVGTSRPTRLPAAAGGRSRAPTPRASAARWPSTGCGG